MKHQKVVRKQSRKTAKKQQKPQWRELGEVAVDSGQLILCDPAYLLKTDMTKVYDQLIDGGDSVDLDTHGILNGAEVDNTWSKKHLGVVLPNFGGDGVFPVMARFENGLLAQVVIDLQQNRWEGFQGERISDEEREVVMARHQAEQEATSKAVAA